MAWFTAKEWKNRLVEFAGRRNLKNVSTNETTVYDVTRNEGRVSQEGDSFSATTMNDLEQRISDAFAEAEEANTQLISELEWKLYQEVEKGDPCNLSTLSFRELLLLLKINANLRRATICIPRHYFDRMTATGDTYTFETGSANRLYGVKITNSSITFTSCFSEGNEETDAAMDIYYR